MIKHRFNVSRPAIESTRRELNSARFCESLRLRETLGYLENDRRTITESPPALLLTRLEVDSNGAAVATLETLETLETPRQGGEHVLENISELWSGQHSAHEA